jgi:16S rRNA (guanine1516-N2)-methyltransferase
LIEIDFTNGAIAHRLQYGGGKGQLLAKAIGVHKRNNLTVLDTTAGLGRDALILANLGCTVTLLERHPLVFTALEHAILKARNDNIDAATRMNVIHTNSIDYLNALTEKPDVIYIDPMYPHTTKSALVKKNMRELRELVGDDSDAADLLNAAIGKATYRITVKRPRLAPNINEHAPDFSYTGKSSRFDVWVA